MHVFHSCQVQRRSSSSAFTLIELLVVITIIAVLAGLLLPVTLSVMKSARKTSAKATESQIVSAVNAYQTEYGQYPVPNLGNQTSAQDYTYDNKTTHNGQLFDVLRALNDTTDPTSATGSLNTRKIVYFSANSVKNAAAPTNGFIIATNSNPTGNANVVMQTGDLIDPFGNLYCVRMDGSYSNAVLNPYSGTGNPNGSATATDDSNSQSQDVLRTGVISWSVGIDGKLGDNGNTVTAPYTPTPGDDVDSWQ